MDQSEIPNAEQNIVCLEKKGSIRLVIYSVVSMIDYNRWSIENFFRFY